MNTTYVHYGHPEYNKEAVTSVLRQSPIRSKPDCGLWASREDAPYGWIDWCRAQASDGYEFGFGNFDSYFKFELDASAKILEIHSEDDILPYIIHNTIDQNVFTQTSMFDGIDYDKIMKDGFDGLELFLSDDYSMHSGVFNMWDCDSIVVWNPDVINA